MQALGQQAAQRLAAASAIVPLTPSPTDDVPARRYIARDETDGALSWVVRFMRQNQDSYKYFNDSTYGGHDRAL